MSGLLSNLGIDGALLAAQAANFLVVFLVLRFLLIKKIFPLLASRKKLIEDGVVKAHEAELRLREIHNIQKEKMREANEKTVEMIKAAQQKAFEREELILARAQEKEREIVAQAKLRAAEMEEKTKEKIEKGAMGLVKQILVRTVEMSPENIDDALIKKAAKSLKISP